MEDKNIRCIKLFNADLEGSSEAENLRKRWLESFAKDVDTTDIFIDNFLWHLFSYERVKAVEGDEAKDKLKAIPKKSLYIFLNDRNIAYRLENAEKFSVEDIRFYQDVYVVDEDFTWTYVSTHENGLCGPYFYMKGKM